MNIKQILQAIKKHSWWSEESPAVHQIAEWAWRGFIESSKYFAPRFLSLGIFIYKNDFLYEETPRDEKLQQFDFLLKKYLADNNYLQTKRQEWLNIIKPLVQDSWELIKNIEKLSRAELAEKYKDLSQRITEQARYSVFIECVDPFTEESLKELLKKELPEVSVEERAEIALIMSTPEFLSFMEEERLEFLGIAQDILQNRASIDKKVKELENKYIWMATHYGEAKPKTREQFKKELEELLEQKSAAEIEQEIKQLETKTAKLAEQKSELLAKYEISQDLLNIFALINELGEWIDERKKYAMQLTFIFYRILDYLEKALKIPARVLGYTTYDELYRWLKDDEAAVPIDILKARRKFSVYLVRLISPGKSKAEFIIGEDAKKIYRALFPQLEVSEFKGMVAAGSKEKIKGKVSVVLNTSTDTFDGDILVTTMTRPDFLPLMRRAKAIITDEGGLTCHAAIVSRELKIPCVIGTKIATKVLKDGDLVEVDAERGVVRKIK